MKRRYGEGCRSLTGAWIETRMKAKASDEEASRSLTGAWIETSGPGEGQSPTGRRSLTGAWIETEENRKLWRENRSLPYGGVD